MIFPARNLHLVWGFSMAILVITRGDIFFEPMYQELILGWWWAMFTFEPTKTWGGNVNNDEMFHTQAQRWPLRGSNRIIFQWYFHHFSLQYAQYTSKLTVRPCHKIGRLVATTNKCDFQGQCSPLLNIQKNYGKSASFMGKSTISMAIAGHCFNSKLFVHQRVTHGVE